MLTRIFGSAEHPILTPATILSRTTQGAIAISSSLDRRPSQIERQLDRVPNFFVRMILCRLARHIISSCRIRKPGDEGQLQSTALTRSIRKSSVSTGTVLCFRPLLQLFWGTVRDITTVCLSRLIRKDPFLLLGFLPDIFGRVAKQADAQDLKSCGTKVPCGFEPRLG